MLFTDEDARHLFHKSPTLLQVICQMLESELVAHHLQLELVDTEQQEKFWVALIVAGNEEYEDSALMQEVLKLAVDKINLRFKRQDEEPTAILESGNHGLVTVRVTEARDFAQLQ